MGARRPTAIVVGGGIAGLTAAASLVREGWDVTVLERAPGYTDVGAGLGLTANGLAVLDHLGVGEAARASGSPMHMDGTTDEQGRWLMRFPRPHDAAPQAYGTARPALHAVLLAAAAGAHLRSGVRVTAVSPGTPGGAPARVSAVTDGGEEELEADLVVAADGLRSAVRGCLVPSARPRYSGMSAWRALVGDRDVVGDGFRVVWGPGAEFGALRVSADTVYWYGYTASPEGLAHDDEKASALQRFDGWADPVASLIDRTPAVALMRHDVYSLAALSTYVHGRVVLVGDAAHAMLPTAGQGANSSLEDGLCVGLVIGRAVATHRGAGGGARGAGVVPDAGLGPALARFDELRRPRTQMIARRAQLAGRLGAHLRAPGLVALRNLAVRGIPGRRAAAAAAAVTTWQVPSC